MARILIVDDSDEIQSLLYDYMKISNHEVVGRARDGEEAVLKFKEKRPDVVLLDIAMPQKDGLQALEEILSVNPDANVIMVTASDDMDHIMKASKNRAVAYLTKPFNLQDLQNAIAMVLEQSATLQE